MSQLSKSSLGFPGQTQSRREEGAPGSTASPTQQLLTWGLRSESTWILSPFQKQEA